MADTFDKVRDGQPLEIAAASWNACLEAGQEYQRRKQPGGGGPAMNSPLNPAVRVLVKNATGATLAVGSVVALGTPIVSPVTDRREAAATPLFPGTAPASAADAFAVLAEPLEPDEIGRAVLMGVAACNVDVVGATDVYAAPKTSDTSQLRSAATGPARILWRESGSSGTKKALVLLEGYSPATVVFDARLTSASGGLWKYVALTLDGTGAEVDDGTEVATYCASPKKIDGVTLANPVSGLRVRMMASKQAGFFEFIPTGMAASGTPGLVSKDDQTISGRKTLERSLQVNSSGNATGIAAGVGRNSFCRVNGQTFSSVIPVLFDVVETTGGGAGETYVFRDEWERMPSGGAQPAHANYALYVGGSVFVCSRVLSGGDYREYVADGYTVYGGYGVGGGTSAFATHSVAPNPLGDTGANSVWMAIYDKIAVNNNTTGAGATKSANAMHMLVVDYSNGYGPKVYDTFLGYPYFTNPINVSGGAGHRYAADGFAIARASNLDARVPVTFHDGLWATVTVALPSPGGDVTLTFEGGILTGVS